MAVKKSTKKPGKKAVRKTGGTNAKKSVKKGDVYSCGVCGLAVKVANSCNCVDACDIICCDEPMKSSSRVCYA
jgi:hypothetical protein